MKNSQATMRKDNTEGRRLYISFELANREWKLSFTDGSKERQRGINAGELDRLDEEMRQFIQKSP